MSSVGLVALISMLVQFERNRLCCLRFLLRLQVKEARDSQKYLSVRFELSHQSDQCDNGYGLT